MKTKRKGWFVPPVKGLLEPATEPTSDVKRYARKAAMSLIDYEPENYQREPLGNSIKETEKRK